MLGFKLRISGAECDRSTNWAQTTAPSYKNSKAASNTNVLKQIIGKMIGAFSELAKCHSNISLLDQNSRRPWNSRIPSPS